MAVAVLDPREPGLCQPAQEPVAFGGRLGQRLPRFVRADRRQRVDRRVLQRPVLREREPPRPPGDSGNRADGRVGVHDLERGQRVEHDRVVLAERLALVEDAHEHRHDARIAFGHQRVDDGAALIAGHRAQHGMNGACGGRVVDVGHAPQRPRARRSCRCGGATAGAAAPHPAHAMRPSSSATCALHERPLVVDEHREPRDGRRAESHDDVRCPDPRGRPVLQAQRHPEHVDDRHADQPADLGEDVTRLSSSKSPIIATDSCMAADVARRASASRQAPGATNFLSLAASASACGDAARVRVVARHEQVFGERGHVVGNLGRPRGVALEPEQIDDEHDRQLAHVLLSEALGPFGHLLGQVLHARSLRPALMRRRAAPGTAPTRTARRCRQSAALPSTTRWP